MIIRQNVIDRSFINEIIQEFDPFNFLVGYSIFYEIMNTKAFQANKNKNTCRLSYIKLA